jgi:hypothetical protein
MIAMISDLAPAIFEQQANMAAYSIALTHLSKTGIIKPFIGQNNEQQEQHKRPLQTGKIYVSRCSFRWHIESRMKHTFFIICQLRPDPGCICTRCCADIVKTGPKQVSTMKNEPLPLSSRSCVMVFNKGKTNQLPPHCPYDLKIDLEEGFSPPLGTIYLLSLVELEALRKFLDENIATGLLHSSSSPHGAPILFFKKKDGSLHLCVDFHDLNQITKKD